MKFATGICKSCGGISAAGARPTLMNSLTHRLTTGWSGVVDIDPVEVPEEHSGSITSESINEVGVFI